MTLRIGTRGSHLARAQATEAARSLAALGHESELVVIRTAGDDSKAPFAGVGPQGVFVREIEEALIAGEIDLAVHSYKDLPSESPRELVVAAVPRRRDAADVLVARQDALQGDTEPWPRPGSVVGTASARRAAWIRELAPGVEIRHLRGNVLTRIRRLRDGDYDAIVLAAAGLARLAESSFPDGPGLALDGLATRCLDPQSFVPSPAQGALAIQCRDDDDTVRDVLADLEDAAARRATAVERALLSRIAGGCDTAFGAYCTQQDDGCFRLTAMVERDSEVRRVSLAGDDPQALVEDVWRLLTNWGQ